MLDISSFLNVNGGTASVDAANQKTPATGASGDFASHLAVSMEQKQNPQNNNSEKPKASGSGKNIPAEVAVVAQNLPNLENTRQNNSEENTLPAELSAQPAQIFPVMNVEPEIVAGDQPVQTEPAQNAAQQVAPAPAQPLPYVSYENTPLNFIEEPEGRSVMTDSSTLSNTGRKPAESLIVDKDGKISPTTEAFLSRVENSGLMEVPVVDNIPSAQAEAPVSFMTMTQLINPTELPKNSELPNNGAVVYMSDITGESNILRTVSGMMNPAAQEQLAEINAESTARYIDNKSIWTRLNLQQLAASTAELSNENKQSASSVNNMPVDEDAELLRNALDARFPAKGPLKVDNIFNRPLEMTVKLSGEAQKLVYADKAAKAQTQTLAMDTEPVMQDVELEQSTRMLTPPERQTPYVQQGAAKPVENNPVPVQTSEAKPLNAGQTANTEAKAAVNIETEGQAATLANGSNNGADQSMQQQPRRRNISDSLMERNERNSQTQSTQSPQASNSLRDAQAGSDIEVQPGNDTRDNQQVKTEERSLRWESARDAANLAKMVQQAGQNGVSKLTVRLAPEHLGRLEIQLTEINGRMDAKIVANSNESRALLASNGDVIRQQLADKGIHIDNMDFSFHDSLARQDRNDQGHAGKETGNNSRFNLNGDKEEDFEQIIAAEQQPDSASRLYA